MEKVNVFVKNNQNFQFQTPKDFVVENINFDFTDSIISDQMDTDNWLSLRSRWCQVMLDQEEQILKVSVLKFEWILNYEIKYILLD